MNGLSIIIPIYNETKNLIPLIIRLHQTLNSFKYPYEIIFIVDNLADYPVSKIIPLKKLYPIRFMQSDGLNVKSQSLIEGFSIAKYDLLCIINGNLQYPPEAIPAMVEKINSGSDIVVANRITKKTSSLRQLLTEASNSVFVRFLHQISFDTESGLKIIKKEILERIELTPSKETLDLQFLLKSMHAGYRISTIQLNSNEIIHRDSIFKTLKDSITTATAALKIKVQGIDPIPFNLKQTLNEGYGFHHKGQKFIFHNNLPIKETAYFRLSNGQVAFFVSILILLVIAAFVNWFQTIMIIIALLSFHYLLDLFFNLFLIFRAFHHKPETTFTENEHLSIDENELPLYTIFCPLYKEWQVLPQFVGAMNNFNYPKEKLEILLLLEENDKVTIEKARSFGLPEYFKIITVPDSQPKTKPKACNYGLQFAGGAYSVIYDAEDVPDPDQLKKAVLAFGKLPQNTACVQAKLNYYNPRQNILTRVFTAEYSLWFDLILTGLQSINAPIPLGGTSNHFKTGILKKLQGWDAFNVTEDCDLGIRLFKNGYKTAMLDSTTFEEANSDLLNWFGQRSRWIKGYIQSYLVHMRTPQNIGKGWKDPHIITFQLIVGGKIISMLVNPFMWILTILYFSFRPTFGPMIESLFPPLIFYPAVLAAILGNFLYLYYYMIGMAKRGYFELIEYAYLVPLYWLYMSAAAWFAAYKIITHPHYWYKTKHGLHLNIKSVPQSSDVIQKSEFNFPRQNPALSTSTI